ncbi:MAG: aldo/keto reductase [Oscillospiraceae bacterium]|nr:aldo/keto reductase [Oscillospiraceae bacterium]
MYYNEVCGEKISALGFGMMRLPTTAEGKIDRAATQEMVDCAIAGGVNYFDTAYPYHGGESEDVTGEALRKYPRESYYLATKYPGHTIQESYDPAEVFEHQLEKCGVEYFDFYLLHNVAEGSIATYMDERWGIVDYFIAQRKAGRIKHLGFSAHASVENLEKFLEYCGSEMEFCQIQLNYLDWTLQRGEEKCALLEKWGLPIWVMEPVRGGKLAKLPDAMEEKLRALRPEESIPAWCFRFLQGVAPVKLILSGMSNMEQMKDNLKTFGEKKPLGEAECTTLLAIAEELKDAVPCTACRYCCDGCPQKIDIPEVISIYNDLKFQATPTIRANIDAMEHHPSTCIDCGQCSAVCPQGIDIPAVMRDVIVQMNKVRSWVDISREREAEGKRMREEARKNKQ